MDYLDPLSTGVETPLNTAQNDEDLGLVLDSLQEVADWCGEIDALKRAIKSAEEYKVFGAQVGELVLRYVGEREHSLSPHYQGPFRVTAAYGNDFYQVCELLAEEALGEPVECHGSRLIRFNGSRTSGTAETLRKLDEHTFIVEGVLDGPREEDGRFLIKWLGVAEPRWEAQSTELRKVLKFKAYCGRKGLNLFGKPLVPVKPGRKGKGPTPVGNQSGTGAAAAAATVAPQESVRRVIVRRVVRQTSCGGIQWSCPFCEGSLNGPPPEISWNVSPRIAEYLMDNLPELLPELEEAAVQLIEAAYSDETAAAGGSRSAPLTLVNAAAEAPTAAVAPKAEGGIPAEVWQKYQQGLQRQKEKAKARKKARGLAPPETGTGQ